MRLLGGKSRISAGPDAGEQPAHAGQGIWTSLAALVLLTLFAAVIIIPFLYMLMISFKSASEMAGGAFLPKGVRGVLELKRDAAWVKVTLSDEQTAALNTIEEVPVVGGASETLFTSTIQTLPADVIYGTVLALDKPALESHEVFALIEAADPYHRLRSQTQATIFVPGRVLDTWEPVAGAMERRNLATLLRRLVANYETLLNWSDLRGGRIVEWLLAGYPRWYFNSLFVAFATVALGVFFDSLAGFAFAKFQFPMRKALFGVLLLTIMIPYPVTLVPSFFIFAKLGLYNTYAALIIPGMVSAFGIFLVRQYVQGIPDEMLNAAKVDGATDFGLFRHIILPTARPVLAALAVFRFIYQWNSYLYPLVLTNRDSMKTVQLGLATMQDQYGTVNYGVQMAGATVAILPILLVYAFMQRHFIAGITLGSVKD